MIATHPFSVFGHSSLSSRRMFFSDKSFLFLFFLNFRLVCVFCCLPTCFCGTNKVGMHTKLTACITIDLKTSAAKPWFARNFNNICGCVTKELDTILTTTSRSSNIIQLAKRIGMWTCSRAESLEGSKRIVLGTTLCVRSSSQAWVPSGLWSCPTWPDSHHQTSNQEVAE